MQKSRPVDGEYRVETDSLGHLNVPKSAYWGAQTQRSLDNFRIGSETMPAVLIHALGMQKRAAAEANMRLKKMPNAIGRAIVKAATEVGAGLHDSHFPLKVWQTGSGTQTNMNANEVIANLAIEMLGGEMGSKDPVHPNDHVNMSQSSNDTFPTVMHMAAVLEIQKTLRPALLRMASALEEKVIAFGDITKIGRTHLQDATPLTVGQEFSAFHAQILACLPGLDQAFNELLSVPQGGTAVGTGLNAPAGFSQIFAERLKEITGLPFVPVANTFSQIAAHDALIGLSGVLNRLAAVLLKIGNDIRLLASGPRCGLGELVLPINEPGSSIMPGKTNPTQSEALTMVAVQVMGNHTTITFGGSQGHFQLNAFKPVMIYNILQSIALLSDGMTSFTYNCLIGLSVDEKVVATHLQNSLMLVTALNPHIGYDNAALIAKKALAEGSTLKVAAIALGLLTAEEFEAYVQPHKMTQSISRQ